MRNRRRSAATQAPERPIDTPSLAFNHMNYTVEDFIDFKESVRRPWRKGRVKELGHHCLIIEPDAGGALVTIYPGKCGRVRQRHGGAAAQLPAELDPEGQAQARARLRIDGVFVAGELPPVRPVRRDGSPLRDFPKPAPPACSPEYLAYVRSHPCCSCPEEGASNPAEVQSEAHHQGRRGIGQKCSDFRCVPLCGLCHLDYTDNGTLPGRDREASLAKMQATQVELLARWAEREARAAAVFVPVPILRLVAACLALFFCLGMTACGEQAGTLASTPRRGYESSSASTRITSSSTAKTARVSRARSRTGDGFPSSRALRAALPRVPAQPTEPERARERAESAIAAQAAKLVLPEVSMLEDRWAPWLSGIACSKEERHA